MNQGLSIWYEDGVWRWKIRDEELQCEFEGRTLEKPLAEFSARAAIVLERLEREIKAKHPDLKVPRGWHLY